jgi:hypothetical protein
MCQESQIPLTRITQNLECTPTGAPGGISQPFKRSGGWYSSLTSGQGIVAELNPANGSFFAAWYTYEPGGQGGGPSSQRWYTIQGPYAGSYTMANVPILETQGGVFDAVPGPSQATVQVGTATVQFVGCTGLNVTYSFTGGSSAGLSGTLMLDRLGPVPPGCT